MIRVERPDLNDADWTTWWDNARKAIKDLVDAYREGDDVKIDSDLYQASKPFLLKLFNNKCAYCETVITITHPGEVEHYRPKGRIRTKAKGIEKVKFKSGKECPHPGYWWLAYHWSNLLPSCIDCNRRRAHTEGEQAGKSDFFEIRGSRAVLPDDPLEAEGALLLNPSTKDFDPHQHFRFNADGTIDPLTEEGRHSVELLGLNLREQLVAARARAYVDAKQTLYTFITVALAAAVDGDSANLERRRTLVNDAWEGRPDYGAFRRKGMEDLQKAVPGGMRMELPIP